MVNLLQNVLLSMVASNNAQLTLNNFYALEQEHL